MIWLITLPFRIFWFLFKFGLGVVFLTAIALVVFRLLMMVLA